MKKDRQVKYPCIYTHFKHNPEGDFNNYTYCTMGISKPMKRDDFEKVVFRCFNAVNTETEQTFSVFAIGNNLYHYEDSYKGELVIYKSLYDGRKPWARPVNEFLSKVPEGRESENPTGQVYRFEEVNNETKL